MTYTSDASTYSVGNQHGTSGAPGAKAIFNAQKTSAQDIPALTQQGNSVLKELKLFGSEESEKHKETDSPSKEDDSPSGLPKKQALESLENYFAAVLFEAHTTSTPSLNTLFENSAFYIKTYDSGSFSGENELLLPTTDYNG